MKLKLERRGSYHGPNAAPDSKEKSRKSIRLSLQFILKLDNSSNQHKGLSKILQYPC